MPTTRSSARKPAGASESPQSSAGNERKANPSPAASPARNKRKADSSPASTKSKAKAPKKQKTIEQTLPDVQDDQAKPLEDSQDTEMKDVPSEPATEANGATTGHEKENKEENGESQSGVGKQSEVKSDEGVKVSGENGTKESTSIGTKDDSKEVSGTSQAASAQEKASKQNHAAGGESDSNTAKAESMKTDSKAQPPSSDAKKAEKISGTNSTTTRTDDDKSEPVEEGTASKPESGLNGAAANGDAIKQSSQREQATPSSILEKGIIYFFFRGRVGIDDPSNVDDIARSYIVLRPLQRGAKITDGTLGDAKNLRVLAVPKKVLPKSPKDRFMVFVEKSKVDLDELKKDFLSSSDYETKTAGTRHTPAATPVGEGVYALTSTGRETHLAYVLTIPKDLSQVQKDIGLEAKGSWVTSVKNPQHKGPSNAQLPNDPAFPQEILDEFRTLRWGQLQAKHLDYENCQMLLIGHKDHSFAKATETEDKEADAKEELEKLGEEDERRVEHLDGDDTVFEDLNIDAKDYPSVQTTW